MDLEPLPLEKTCLGCSRYFLLYQTLPLQNMTVQFKNYAIPIKQQFLKSVLLKTIVAFLNSKGGTIFMGVDDSSGQVLGIPLERKQMDQFRLVVKSMLEKVVPAIDLVKKEEVSVEFIPVLEGKERYFYGKYVIKFIVQQGDTSILYCVSEKIQSMGRTQVEVISTFRRHNLGGVQEVKGAKVIEEIYLKARNPYETFNTFHKDCNPQPIIPLLMERSRPERMSRVFEIEDSPESLEIPYRSSSKKSISSQRSQAETIINRIQGLETSIRDYKEPKGEKLKANQIQNPIKAAQEAGYIVYFQNVRDTSVSKLINYLKNSTPARYAQQIFSENGIVCARFKTKMERDDFIETMNRDPFNRLMNEFGLNSKVSMLKSLSNKPAKIQEQVKVVTPKQTNEVKFYCYRLLFYKYVPTLEKSVENYLKNSININIKRKMNKTKEGIQLLFDHQRDMSAVYDMCLNLPHSQLLGMFWEKGALKIQKFERKPKDDPRKAVKPKMQVQHMSGMVKIEEEENARLSMSTPTGHHERWEYKKK